jgi:hypothetical protein
MHPFLAAGIPEIQDFKVLPRFTLPSNGSTTAPEWKTPVDNSQNPTNKAKNRAPQVAVEIFTFVKQSYT